LEEFVERVTEKNTCAEQNVLTISAQYGLVSQSEYFSRRVASDNLATYYLLRRGDFAYNKSYSKGFPFGTIRRLERYDRGVVSPLYICFRTTGDNTDAEFLRHYLDSGVLDEGLGNIAKEGVRNHGLLNVAVGDFFSLAVPLPPLPEQGRIAEILDTVDEAIRKTEEIITKLKQVKQGLLHDLLTRGIDDNGELRDPDRHPEQFKSSPLGRIPKAWVAIPAGDVVFFSGGFGFPHRFQGHTEGEVPFFKVSDQSTPGNEKFFCRANNYVSRSVATEQGWRPAPPDAVAFAKVGAALLLNRRRILVRESLVDNNMMTAIAGERVEPRFMYWWLTTIDFATFVQPGALPSVNQGQLTGLLVALPSVAEQKQIAVRLDAADLRLDAERAQLGKLELLKQGLMDDLLTGRVRVTALLDETPE
jgi:type I restriction enzyme S subunit